MEFILNSSICIELLGNMEASGLTWNWGFFPGMLTLLSKGGKIKTECFLTWDLFLSMAN